MTELSSCTNNVFTERCGVNVFINPAQSLGTDDDCVLIVGQIHPDGTAAPGLYQYNANTAPELFGSNGTLIQSVTEFLEGCPTADVYIYAAADPAATAGSADVTITGVAAAAASGTVFVWVNGQVYSVAFDPTVDTDDDVAERLSALIGSDFPFLNVSVAGNVISLETSETGEIAGFLDVRGSYSCRPELVTSADVVVEIASVDGAGVPDLSGLPDIVQGCEFVSNPYTDSASMAAVASYACAQWSGGSSTRVYGTYYGDAASAAAFGLRTNSPFFSYIAVNGALTAPYLETASYACIAYRNLNCQADALAASLSGQVFPSMLAPEADDLYSASETASLIENGVGYAVVTRAKDVTVGRAVTTYTVADNGTLDNSLRDVNKPAIYACLSRRLREGLTAKFTGFSFRNDGVVGRGRGASRVTTQEGVENCIITFAQEFSDDNLIQNIEAFIDTLEVSVDDATGCISVFTDPDIPCPLCCMNVFLGAA